MIVRKILFLGIFALQTLTAMPLAKQLQHVGYVEIGDKQQAADCFDALYACFDEFIAFLQANPVWTQKLYAAKERFIRAKERNYYSSDFFGFYDESKRAGRHQVAFYYATHFHEFIEVYYPEFQQVPVIRCFFEACREMQKPCGKLFAEVATELGIEPIFSSQYGQIPILFKVIKYLPSYIATRPHYDGSVLSLFLDSTDNASLLLSPYKSSFTVDEFSSPGKEGSSWQSRSSSLLIPGVLLTEFAIYPTPHIVMQSGKIRYATIAFAMKPHCTFQKNEFAALPSFKD